MKAHGPDGRVWTILRRPHPPHPLAVVLPGRRWLVEARAGDEMRLWEAASRRAAGNLIGDVALALRTGGPGPPGELRQPDLDGDAPDEG